MFRRSAEKNTILRAANKKSRRTEKSDCKKKNPRAVVVLRLSKQSVKIWIYTVATNLTAKYESKEAV